MAKRYGAYYDLAGWRALLTAVGFVELAHSLLPGLPRSAALAGQFWRKRWYRPILTGGGGDTNRLA
jgi:hypothetical protein